MPEIPTVGRKPAIYARVSTEEQREGQTINSQIAELERFATEKGFEVAAIYKDEGWSGAVMARPELDRLRDDARKGLFQTVLINDVDRLARDVTHLGVIKRDLERSGVQLMFRKLPSEASPTFNLMVNILGSFAEFERELISDRTRRGRRYKIEVRKQYLGSNSSYGYRYIPSDQTAGKQGFLEVVPQEAAVVRQMYEWVDAEGLSARRVLKRLNALGISPRKGASGWAKSSVLRILRNEMYAGVWYYNKHQSFEPGDSPARTRYRKHLKSSHRRRPKAEWLPLELPGDLGVIQRDQWQRVQQRLDRNITFSPRNEKHQYLLKGLVYCAGCGACYVGDPCHGRYYYRCGARCKRCPIITETILDDTVWNAIEKAIVNPNLILTQIARQNDSETKEATADATELKAIDGDANQLRMEEARLLEAYRLGVITPAQLGRELETLNLRKETLKTQRVRLDNSGTALPKAQTEKSVREYCTEATQNLASFGFEQRQEFLRTLIRRVIFDGQTARIHGEIPIPFGVVKPADQPSADLSRGRIATTGISSCGRNPGEKKRYGNTSYLDDTHEMAHPFEIHTEIARDKSQRTQASRSNVVKAIAKRWVGPHQKPPL